MIELETISVGCGNCPGWGGTCPKKNKSKVIYVYQESGKDINTTLQELEKNWVKPCKKCVTAVLQTEDSVDEIITTQ